MLRRFITIFIGTLLSAFAAVSPCSAQMQWLETPYGRSASLSVSSQGKTGFTLLSPQQSGLTFSNGLDEAAAAANRVLYNGAGVAAGDFDQDGLPDLYFCSLNGRNTLYRNLGGWRFADVTSDAGLPRDTRFYRGAVFADINGDKALDLLVGINGGGVECYLNNGRGRFTNNTSVARTGSRYASTTLALADVDGDGDLDLYVANNRVDDIRDKGQVDLRMVNGQMVVPPELRERLVVVDGQLQEYGEPDQLFMNDGSGRFTQISWTGGRFRDEHGSPLTGSPLDWGLSATFRDINGDRFPDIYVCNDFWTPDRIWLNDGKGRFRAAPPLAWRNMCASSMGVDFADIDRDGDVDCFVVDMLSRDLSLRRRQKLAQPPMASGIGMIEDRPQIMRNTLFLNRGDDTFAEIANFGAVDASEWAWSPVFLDVDLDGYEDLLITSGHAKDVQDLDAAAQIRARQHSWKGFTNEVERQKAFTRELMDHMRLYPRLDSPVVAFRNLGGGRFEDVTKRWGTDLPGVHHALATADFDGDGDLDLVVNCLGSVAGLYRNETTAPRVAVRLRGRAPNTQGIGAQVKLLGGAVAMQSQEIVSGGRYLAGSEPMLCFAAGREGKEMTIEVAWRNGRTSRVTGVLANRIYEIDEGKAPSDPGAAVTNRTPTKLFQDVSRVLQHVHHEELFNDFERQPLLPHRLSQLGPGVSWVDIDEDGKDDMVVASGKGGKMAVLKNDGEGRFKPWAGAGSDSVVTRDQTTILGWRSGDGTTHLLAGAANYEDGLASGASVRQNTQKSVEDLLPGTPDSTGPLAMADIDGDGDLDLFVGGRVVPGRYPEAATSRLFRFDGTRFQPDTVNNLALTNVGLVSGAVFSDLTGDGFPELVVGCEWGPIKIFKNTSGNLKLTDPSVTLDSQLKSLSTLTGWWNGVAAGDFDGDGRLDIVASNWGLNSAYAASPEHPLEIYYGDLLDRGMVDVIETEWDAERKRVAPRRRLDILQQVLPVLQERFPSHRKFSDASVADLLGPFQGRVRKAAVSVLASMVFLNRGDRFEAAPLPTEAQLAPSFGVSVADLNGDGNEDLFLSQNFFATTAETPRLDAGRGVLLRGDGKGAFSVVPGQESGIEVYGEGRGTAVADYDGDGRTDIVVGQNGAATKLFRNATAKPGLRVRLFGPKNNPQGIGAVVRLKFGSRLGPGREIHAGSGYWSQDSAVPVLGFSEAPSQVWVRWPGGKESATAVEPAAGEILVRPPE